MREDDIEMLTEDHLMKEGMIEEIEEGMSMTGEMIIGMIDESQEESIVEIDILEEGHTLDQDLHTMKEGGDPDHLPLRDHETINDEMNQKSMMKGEIDKEVKALKMAAIEDIEIIRGTQKNRGIKNIGKGLKMFTHTSSKGKRSWTKTIKKYFGMDFNGSQKLKLKSKMKNTRNNKFRQTKALVITNSVC